MLIYVETCLVDGTCDEEKEAQETNFAWVSIEDVHNDSIAECNQETNYARQCLSERCEKDTERRQWEQALAWGVVNVIFEEHQGAVDARDDELDAEVVVDTNCIVLVVPHDFNPVAWGN